MVIVFAFRVLDCGFDPPSDQAKDYEISKYCFSTKQAVFRIKKNTDWLGVSV
jgi:hypothetical protein